MPSLMVALCFCMLTLEDGCLVLISATDQVVCVLLCKGRYTAYIHYNSVKLVYFHLPEFLLAFLLIGLEI